ncbi:MAG TPA: TetR family transcriptional regulator [Acidimicrobiales bacterium]|nr:TetR family transcriptional regulator [Acidimicrobiales bacterium]
MTDDDQTSGQEGAEPNSHRRPGRPRHAGPSKEFLARRAEIIGTAAEIFQTSGYEVSLDVIADSLQLRKASVYYYVHSKAELLFLVFDQAITQALDHLDALALSGSARDRLSALVRHQVQMISSDRRMFSVFFDHRPELRPEYETQLREKERRYLQAFSDAVETAIAEGVLPPMDARYAGQALLGMTSWVYKWFDTTRDDASTFADTAVSLITRGTR